MKNTTSTKIVNFTKSLVTLGSNFGIVTLSFFSIASLVLLIGQFDISQLMPEGAEVTRSGYEAWGGVNAFVLTFVAGNTLLTYGLIKLKQFAKDFKESDLFEDITISFLKKGAVLMTVVGAIQGITELILNPAHIIFNFSIAAFLFIASLVLASIKNQFSNKVA